MTWRLQRALETILVFLLAIAGLFGLLGALCSFIPDAAGTRPIAPELSPLCLGPSLAALGCIAMILRRRPAERGWSLLPVALILWFVGVSIVGSGVTAALLNDEPAEFLTNLGYSTALCLAPGAFLTLGGVGVFVYLQRQRPSAQAPQREAAVRPSRKRGQGRAEKLCRAAEYRSRIAPLIRQQRVGAFGEQVASIPATLETWLARLESLSHRLDAYEADTVIQRDLRETPLAIGRLRTRSAAENDPELRAQMLEALARYQEHQEQLTALQSLMRRTELEIDSTVTAMGTLYARLQLLGAKEIDSARAERLRADVDEQVQRLGDLLAALDELHGKGSEVTDEQR